MRQITPRVDPTLQYAGISSCVLLGIILSVLRIVGLIHWHWALVLMPFWSIIVVALGVLIQAVWTVLREEA